jgi:hypothetical protein
MVRYFDVHSDTRPADDGVTGRGWYYRLAFLWTGPYATEDQATYAMVYCQPVCWN